MKIKNLLKVELSAALIGLLLLQFQPVIGGEYSAWNYFQDAASGFRQNAPAENVLSGCRLALKESQDPVLTARVEFLQAKVLTGMGKTEDAMRILQKIEEGKTDIPLSLREEAGLRRAILYLQATNPGEGLRLLRVLHEQGKTAGVRMEAAFALAWDAANNEKWKQCRLLLDEIENLNPVFSADHRMNVLKARLAIAEQNSGEAIRLLENTEDPLGLSLLARAYEQADKRILAVSIYKKINDMYPRSPAGENAMLQAVEVYLRAEDWLAAQSELERFLQYFPNSGRMEAVHFRLGWVYLNLRQFDRALLEFSGDAQPEHRPFFRYMEAECYRVMGSEAAENYQKAVRLFNNIAALNMQSAIAPLAKIKAAITEFEMGDTTGALIDLKQFLSIYPKNEMIPAVNFMLAIHEAESPAKKYFNKIIQSTVSGAISDAAFFALQNEDYRKKNYQTVINRYSFLKDRHGSGALNYWQRANYLLIAESAYFLKHYDLARENYQKVLSPKTDNLKEKAELGLVWCDFYTESADSAAGRFRELSRELSPASKPLAKYGLATAQFYQGKYEEAVRNFPVDLNYQKQPEYLPVVIRSLYHTGESYYRLEFYADAILTWRQLARQFPASALAPDALYHAADLYFRANHFAEADSVFLKILNDYPASTFAPDSRLRLAQSAYNAGNYQAAIERYQKFIDKYPDSEQNKTALEGIQYSYYQLGQTEQAEETFKKVAEQSANSDLAVDAMFRLASNKLAEGNFAEAVTEFKEILTRFPNSSYAADAQFSLAKSFMAQENYHDAIREFKQFVQYFPDNTRSPEALFLLGVSYFSVESYLSAIDCFEDIIQKYPDSEYHSSALQNSGWCYSNLQDYAQAVEYFEKYLESGGTPEDAQKIRMQIANALNQMNRTGEATEIYTALQSAADRALACEACYHLGMIYLKTDRIEDAETAFTRGAKNSAPSDYYRLSSLAQLAAIYENRGEEEKAINAYKMLTNSTAEEKWISAAEERIQALTGIISAGKQN